MYHYFISSNSTSNINVEFAGIGPAFLDPYPSSGGIINFLFPPVFIVESPSSHPVVNSGATETNPLYNLPQAEEPNVIHDKFNDIIND